MVGIGSHAYRNLLPAMTYLPVELVAICNHSDKELARVTAAQYGCRSYQSTREMYEKERLDAVFLCVSPEMHPKLTMEALDAGLHVWMEKPVAMRTEEVEQMLEKRGDRVVMVGYKKAFMPATGKAIEMVNSPEFGGLESILAVYPMKIPEYGKAILRDRKRTDWLNNGCHPLSVMLAVGGGVDWVQTITGKSGVGSCIIAFKNGVMGNLHLASGPHPIEEYRFYAPDWHLHIDNVSRVTLQRGIPSVYGKTTSFIPEGVDTGAVVWEPQNCKSTLENKSEFSQGIYQEMRYFCDCVLNGLSPQIGSLEFALELTKVYESLLISDGTRIAVK